MGEKAHFECLILFPHNENDLKRKHSLKLGAGIVSHTKSNICLINAHVKHEAEHMLDIFEKKTRGIA
jgi:hypothetical protein